MTLPGTENAEEEDSTRPSPIRDEEAGDDQTDLESLSIHPIPCMQGAFEESIMESADPAQFKKANDKLNAHARRQQLLELEDFSKEYSSRWRQKPGAKFHPLWKLIAQISFGVNLLYQRQAKSDGEVVKILQTHVDEVDNFLEDTMADLDLAIKDINERISFLLLALEHSRTFNKMLTDKTFRNAIIDGNDIIERILQRTSRAVSNSLRDINTGMAANAELAKFLERLGPDWTNDVEDLQGVYTAMRANADGWCRCFEDLRVKSDHLTRLMVQLQSIIGEVAKRCGIASRKRTSYGPSNGTGCHKHTLSVSSEPPRPKPSRISVLDKPLPPDPLNEAIAMSQICNALTFTESVQHEKPLTKARSTSRPNNESYTLREVPQGQDSANMWNIDQSPCIMAMSEPRVNVATRHHAECRRVHPEICSLDSSGYAADSVPKRSEESSQSTTADSAYYSGSDTLLASHQKTTNPLSPMEQATIPSGVGEPTPSSRKNTSQHASKPSLTALPSCPIPSSRANSLAIAPKVNHKKQSILKISSLASIKSILGRKHTPREKYNYSGSLGGHVVITELQ